MKLALGRQNPTFAVTAVQLRADITYSKATVAVIMDDRGLNKYVRDYINEIDELYFSVSKGFVTHQDAIDQLSVGVSKSFSDTYGSTDIAQIMAGFSRAFSDVIFFADSIDNFVFGKRVLETIATIETLQFSSSKSLFDSVVIIDNADANSGDGLEYTDVKPSSDQISTSDSANAEIVKPFTDAVSISESIVQAAQKLLTDGVVIPDLVVIDASTVVSDTYNSLDLFERVFNANLAPLDSVLTLDELASIGVSKVLTEAVATASNGIIFMTDYVDVSYLLEDYVGISTTFS